MPEHAAQAAGNGAMVYLASVAKSVEGVAKGSERLRAIARDHGMTVLMANCLGMADGMDCPGRSAVWDSNGTTLGQLDDVHEGILVFDTEPQAIAQQNLLGGMGESG